MKHLTFFLPVLFATSLLPSHAQDGEQLYGLYCSACHGADGKGGGNGTLPPLAGSDWIHGNAKRTIAIVLKGLHGPVQVAGKSYNLEMPPQEDSLTEQNITAILNYVHKAWGNKGQDVKIDMVRVTKSEYADRKKPWTADEILKIFPLEKKATFLNNLTSQVYKGNWDKLPDFSKSKAENIEEEHSGIIDIKLAELKENYAIVWQGDFMAPKTAEYEFVIFVDDAGRLIFDKKTVAEVNGIGPAAEGRAGRGKVKLKSGPNPIRLEYMQQAGEQSFTIGWRQVGTKNWTWISADRPPGKQGPDPIMLIPSAGKTVIYRNFIKGVSARAIGFGFPGKVNLAYSADHLAPELIWSGDFIDASKHWVNRGQGSQSPASKDVHQLTTQKIYPPSAKFKGYTLDPKGNPTFHIQSESFTITDAWKPGADNTLIRTMTMTRGSTPIEIDLSKSKTVTPQNSVTLKPNSPTEIIYKLK